jgi:O-antigen/teichoic acid export membrane protein
MRDSIAKGAAWMVAFRFLDRSIGLVSTAVLARLLLPNDFGLVAMAMSVIAIVELATAFSFDVALIQRHNPSREHFDTAWTLAVIIACGGAVVTSAAALPASVYYGDDRLAAVMFAIGAGWLVSGFENVGMVNFRREMNFAMEFRFLATKRFVTFLVTLASALTLRTYWALVIGMVTGRVVGVVLSYAMHDFRPRLSLARSRELFSFSGWLWVNSLLNVFSTRTPHFFIGRLFGAQPLGAYTVAAEIAQLAQSELIAPINRAMFPGLSRLATDLPEFRRICVDSTSTIVLVALPLSVGIAVLAGPFVRVMLGPQWGSSVPIIQVLALAAAITALTANNISIYLALGRPYLATITQGLRLVSLVIGVAWLTSNHGLIGAAYAELAAAVLTMVVSLLTLFVAIGVRPLAYVGGLWRPIVASGLMGLLISWWVEPNFDAASVTSAIRELVSGVLIGFVSYPVAIAFLWLLSGRRDGIEPQLVLRLNQWRASRATSPTAQ